jgi:DNA helicase II / ATP-dependent DNA helicase PcrA
MINNLAPTDKITIEDLWKEAKFTPNDPQRDAILHSEGPLYLTAGPGSGKTRVLLWRTLNLLVFHELQPEQIFLSTFTEKAALQLKEGLQSLLGIVTNRTGRPFDLTQMYIGTVHSLCQKILLDRRKFSNDRRRSQPPFLMDELGQYFHISRNRNWNQILEQAGLGEDSNQIINAIFGFPSQSKHAAVTNCMAFFNRVSEECIDPKKAIATLSSFSDEAKAYLLTHQYNSSQMEVLFRLYSAYQETLLVERTRLTDFALLQQEAMRTLEQCDNSGSAFKYVIVDEYQDTNTIQERLFFKLAKDTKNICVVGDDDQALYRFRGATVENFVEFPSRCQQYLGTNPQRISLTTNYRSCPKIVDFYKGFMDCINWSTPDGSGAYRVLEKEIQANRKESFPSVVINTPAKPEIACAEIAQLVWELIDQKKVRNANQIAFLFPSLKYRGNMVKPVEHMKTALEAKWLKVYAPRASRFLEVDESYDIFGLFLQVFGRPHLDQVHGYDFENYRDWIAAATQQGEDLMKEDPLLTKFVKEKRDEIQRIVNDYQILLQVIERNHWELNQPYNPDLMKRTLYSSPNLSEQGKRLISSQYLDNYVRERIRQQNPLSLVYIITRITSLDWNVLDLFYRFCGFEHFKQMFDAAEQNGDEGPVANLGLITQYLSRFVDDRIAIITANQLTDDMFQRVFFISYIFALYRLGETEIEDPDDPFPKGRIPFLTIHQAKGLEFPIVVLGNPRKNDDTPNQMEVLIRPFLEREPGEPLERMPKFDTMRMFYVALSRAKNLLVIAAYRGSGQHMNAPFQQLLDDHFPKIQDLDITSLPVADEKDEQLPKAYSFTADYQLYKKCPRQYMIFRKFGFAPSRTQTMFFGDLVHRTLEDLHQEIIRRKIQSSQENQGGAK